jgi:hypothetical protein
VETKDGLKWLTKRERQFAISYYYKPQCAKTAAQPANHYIRYSDIKSTNKHAVAAASVLPANDLTLATSNLTRSAAAASSLHQNGHHDRTAASTNGRIVYKDLIENLNEWKFHYLISQINSLMDDEAESLEQINDVHELVSSYEAANRGSNATTQSIYFKITEALKVNI